MKETDCTRILCPVDLSDNSQAAIKLATTLAREHHAVLAFMFVSPMWLPEEAMFTSDYSRESAEEDKAKLMRLRPSDPNVKFDHLLVEGNPGPAIVKASLECDLIVMATHGYGALMRMLMGGVAQYVLRHAKCPVILARTEVRKSDEQPQQAKKSFVTRSMVHAMPVRKHDNMDEVLVELDRAGQTAAPVVDVDGKCIGILTKTDIERFLDLQKRFDERDPSAIPEMFESDEYGHIRCGNLDFPQVCRHMTQPVITITNNETIDHANRLFSKHPNIHHLVVVDESNRPIGVLTSNLSRQVAAS